MTRSRFLAALACWLALAPFSLVNAQVPDGDFVVGASVALDAYRATVEAQLGGVLTGTRLVAAQDAARSGDWSAIRGPLAALAANVPEQAAVWFAQPDGSYFTVDKGRTGDSLRDRDYFPELLAGRDVVGALVISKSTDKRSLIVASPVLVDDKVTGAVGVSLDASKLAMSIDHAIRFPPDVIFYALNEQGQTALHRAGDLIFVFPSDVGSPTLRDSVKTMLGQPEGVVHYQYGGGDRTAVFQRSRLTGWVFVLGKSHQQR